MTGTKHHSPGYWRWRARVARRWIRQAHRRLHPPIQHLALWLCVHHYEGAWNANTGNGYYGGLQMTANWGVYGIVLAPNASVMTPYAQMRAAETGWRIIARRQGSSYARYVWLPSQWWHPDCLAAYA